MDVTIHMLMGLDMTDNSQENTDNTQESSDTDSFPLFVVGLSMVLAVVPLVLAATLSAMILGGGEGQLSLAFFKFDQAEARESAVEPVQPAPVAVPGTENLMIANLEAVPQEPQTSPGSNASTMSAEPTAGLVNADEPVVDHRLDAEWVEIAVNDSASIAVIAALPDEPVSTPIEPMLLPDAEVTSASLIVSLSTPRGHTPEYKVAETLEMTVTVSEDAYLYCYYRDGSSTVYRVFPNEFQPDAHAGAGQSIVIPGKQAEFEIVFEYPQQEEELGCLATREDIDVALPETLKTDLVPLPVETIDEVVRAVLQIDPTASDARMRIHVGG